MALPLLETFTYRAPAGASLALGHAVQVPFGRRKVTGYVVGPGDPTVPEERLKEVDRLLDETPAFDADQLAFFQWIASYYLAGLGEVIATALPTELRVGTRRVLVPTPEGIEELARPSLVEDARTLVLREVVARPATTLAALRRRLHAELEEEALRRAVAGLERQRLVAWEAREQVGPRRMVISVRLVGDPAAPPRGERMRQVIATLAASGGVMDLDALVEAVGPGARPAVVRLEELGLVARQEREDREASAGPALPGASAPPAMNAAQQAAVDAIAAAEGPGTFLLHGVTGAGKTEVYLHAAARVLERGRQVLVLVPEIALTPQLVGRFHARFGDAIAVLHSGLGPGERLRHWRRIRAGEARVAVGARSALFAPFSALGLVVVDEEHDDSYKQGEGLRYHARDLAVVRAWQAGCPSVLGTATPSAESWQNAREGRYRMLRLPERATARTVPRIELVDMRGRPPGDPLSAELREALERTLAARGKAIILYNRRGYAPVVECGGCGGSFSCPSCGVGLVYHRGGSARLQCHHCGYHQPFRPDCPTCGADLQVLGHGTARIEEALAAAFPEARIGRMDADTTGERGAHHRILDAFRAGELQILVGTQMVAKGHDFPDVHLAAVVGVDHLLLMPDFRSAERVHALVTQLAGRAGRGEVQGRVLLQTCQPEHFVFSHLVAPPELPLDEDAAPPAFPLDAALDGFLVRETRQRRLLGHPPFAALVLVRLEGTDRERVREAARDLATRLRASRGAPRVQGPVAAPLSRLVGRWRYQLVLRSADRAAQRRWLREQAELLAAVPASGVRITVDVDPRDLM
ncbi:primosomal protein N' [Myxococcota bacterium]|nr:primosomal protein N' [Myxococcota bacterium]